MAIAKGLEAQQQAVGKDQTALINVVRELSSGTQRFMPENLALNLGEGGLGASLNALVPLAMRRLSDGAPEGDTGAAGRPRASRAARTANGAAVAAEVAAEVIHDASAVTQTWTSGPVQV